MRGCMLAYTPTNSNEFAEKSYHPAVEKASAYCSPSVVAYSMQWFATMSAHERNN